MTEPTAQRRVAAFLREVERKGPRETVTAVNERELRTDDLYALLGMAGLLSIMLDELWMNLLPINEDDEGVVARHGPSYLDPATVAQLPESVEEWRRLYQTQSWAAPTYAAFAREHKEGAKS